MAAESASLMGRIWNGVKSAGSWVAAIPSRFYRHLFGDPIKLSYFDEVLKVEHHAINARRSELARRSFATASFEPIRKLEPEPPDRDRPMAFDREGSARPQSPNLPAPDPDPQSTADPNNPEPARIRPQPIPCTAIGLALSGGGIRSAAFSLGALQSLAHRDVIARTDYLSTVSGGGYIGASMTACMSKTGGTFPFGNTEFRDNVAVGHIRNYSNYLLPRARSGVRNVLDVAAILLRGLLANAIAVTSVILAAAFLTFATYPQWSDLSDVNFIPRLVAALPSIVVLATKAVVAAIVPDWLATAASWIGTPLGTVAGWIGTRFGVVAKAIGLSDLWAGLTWLYALMPLTAWLAILVVAVLTLWALARSSPQQFGNDADSPWLDWARRLLGLTIVSAVLDIQPVLIVWLDAFYRSDATFPVFVSPPVIVGAVIVALFARRLGAFLERTRLSLGGFVRLQRIVTKALLIVAGLVLPLVLLVVYWHVAAWLIGGNAVPRPSDETTTRLIGGILLLVTFVIAWHFQANAYSLHQFYKDRLSKAFLFEVDPSGTSEPKPLLDFKLSEIEPLHCPYHLINTALNVQGSKEANRRGRNAEFFTFSRDFVGSDLTLFAQTPIRAGTTNMETIDPKLDMGAAMAISGAAVSANMGSNTVRWLSPTLALLNVRLGYWLRNPRDLAKSKDFRPLRELRYSLWESFYLLLEMFNVLDEESSFVYLSDGGHIENLGIYQLLKRGCRLIIAIDAEADPDISCASLLKVERYARIDLGVRILLPWERIAERNRGTDRSIRSSAGGLPERHEGPHCAVGPILYQDGSRGILLYFKSSLSGDEKDYVLDYKRRNMDFPHETTGDQFFTEEQFEVYRALGHHVVEGFFTGDDISWLQTGPGAWPTAADAVAEVRRVLGLP